MINVKKSHKNKMLYLKNTQPLTQSQIPTIPPPHTRLCANTKLLQHQKYKKLKAQQIA